MLDDLTEEQLDRLKAAFGRLADTAPRMEHKLREAREELEEVGDTVEKVQETLVDATVGLGNRHNCSALRHSACATKCRFDVPLGPAVVLAGYATAAMAL